MIWACSLGARPRARGIFERETEWDFELSREKLEEEETGRKEERFWRAGRAVCRPAAWVRVTRTRKEKMLWRCIAISMAASVVAGRRRTRRLTRKEGEKVEREREAENENS